MHPIAMKSIPTALAASLAVLATLGVTELEGGLPGVAAQAPPSRPAAVAPPLEPVVPSPSLSPVQATRITPPPSPVPSSQEPTAGNPILAVAGKPLRAGTAASQPAPSPSPSPTGPGTPRPSPSPSPSPPPSPTTCTIGLRVLGITACVP